MDQLQISSKDFRLLQKSSEDLASISEIFKRLRVNFGKKSGGFSYGVQLGINCTSLVQLETSYFDECTLITNMILEVTSRSLQRVATGTVCQCYFRLEKIQFCVETWKCFHGYTTRYIDIYLRDQ